LVFNTVDSGPGLQSDKLSLARTSAQPRPNDADTDLAFFPDALAADDDDDAVARTAAERFFMNRKNTQTCGFDFRMWFVFFHWSVVKLTMIAAADSCNTLAKPDVSLGPSVDSHTSLPEQRPFAPFSVTHAVIAREQGRKLV
jgi:hypothetical protein